MFDSGKKGQIEKEKIRTILNTLGAQFDADELEALLEENDVDGKGVFAHVSPRNSLRHKKHPSKENLSILSSLLLLSSIYLLKITFVKESRALFDFALMNPSEFQDLDF